MPFLKGQSGNPGGRPKTDQRIRELAQAKTEVALATLAEIAEDKKCSPGARVSAAVALLDRGWGKPQQAIEHSGDREEPLVIQPVFVAPPVYESAEEWQQKHGNGEATH